MAVPRSLPSHSGTHFLHYLNSCLCCFPTFTFSHLQILYNSLGCASKGEAATAEHSGVSQKSLWMSQRQQSRNEVNTSSNENLAISLVWHFWYLSWPFYFLYGHNYARSVLKIFVFDQSKYVSISVRKNSSVNALETCPFSFSIPIRGDKACLPIVRLAAGTSPAEGLVKEEDSTSSAKMSLVSALLGFLTRKTCPPAACAASAAQNNSAYSSIEILERI